MRIESLHDLHGHFPDIDGFWNFEDLAETESKIRNLLPQEAGGWNSKNLEILTQLGRVQGLQGNLSLARATLDQAQKAINQIEGPDRIRPEIRFLLEQGRIFCLSMTPFKAQPFFTQAWTLANDANETFFAIDAALMLSISQPPKSKNEWLQKALALAEKTEKEQGQLWLAQLYTMDGWHSFDFRLFDKALESFQKAFQRPRAANEKNKEIIIRWCVARALRAVGRTEEALDMQQRLLTELTSAATPNGHVFLEVAECLQALQKHQEAKTYFEFAYKELSSDGWYSDNKKNELGRIQTLSKKHY
ncbi:MAG: hypothetical protein V4736_12465 [Bdellovibrionota bacterium]